MCVNGIYAGDMSYVHYKQVFTINGVHCILQYLKITMNLYLVTRESSATTYKCKAHWLNGRLLQTLIVQYMCGES